MAVCNETIRKVWETELEILDVVHSICTANCLKYSLAYGTLIGAIRHKGFIPWDDDIDIIMPRDDYETLLLIWNNIAPGGYILQNIDTNPDFPNTFSKITKNDTTFLQSDSERNKSFHKGIFIDIFPADRVAPGYLFNRLQYVACALNLLFTRGYTSGTAGFMGIIEKTLLLFPRSIQLSLRKNTDRFIRSWNNNSHLRWFSPSTIEFAKHYYPPTLFDEMDQVLFCQKQYSCVADPDAFLRLDYGDYMQLPPEEERTWKHHPIIIDFEHNYEDLPKELRNV